MAPSTLCTLSLLLLSIALSFQSALADVPCPFNPEECTCSSTTSPIDSVYCQSPANKSMVTFSAPPGTTYKIDTFTISGNISDLPSSYLSIFSHITNLLLAGDPPGQTPSYWDAEAFDGCKIDNLHLRAIAQLSPFPDALVRLGSTGLNQLWIQNYDPFVYLQIPVHQFIAFTSLESIQITDYSNVSVDPIAFYGLENRLRNLSIDGCTNCPYESIRNLESLENLRFSYYKLPIDFPHGAFSKMHSLQSLIISSNFLTPDENIFEDLPPKLKTIKINTCKLPGAPKGIFNSNLRLDTLDLMNNQIQSIGANDFYGSTTIDSINLQDNQLLR